MSMSKHRTNVVPVAAKMSVFANRGWNKFPALAAGSLRLQGKRLRERRGFAGIAPAPEAREVR